MNTSHTRPLDSPPLLLLIALTPFLLALSKYMFWESVGVFDFYAFHLAGGLANSGQLEQLYNPQAIMAQYEAAYGVKTSLPWFYPPLLLPYCQFLALFPVATAYLVHSIISLSLYYALIIKAFPARWRDIIVLSALPITITLTFGHPTLLLLVFALAAYKIANKHLILALVFFMLAAAKPQIGGVLLLLFFLKKLPRSLGPSAVIAAVTILSIATLYTWDSWVLFFNSLLLAGHSLQAQTINQIWMSSAFISLQSHGMPTGLALVFHFALLIGLAMAAMRFLGLAQPDRFWFAAGVAMVFFSPYLMFYDLAFLLFPIIIALPHINTEKGKNWVYLLLLWEASLPIVMALEPEQNFNFIIGVGVVILLFAGLHRYRTTPQIY